jgi:hypothetical protein
MPEEVDDDTNARLGHRVFRPFIDPDDPDFNHLIRFDLSDIIRARQMHQRQHMPTCFKYKSKKCRSRFPRAIVEITYIDPETGVIRVARDHQWLNNFNKWLAVIMRANHDVQFLYTKNLRPRRHPLCDEIHHQTRGVAPLEGHHCCRCSHGSHNHSSRRHWQINGSKDVQ